MWAIHLPGPWPFWHALTRLGEAQLALPLALAAAALQARAPESRSQALRWMGWLGAAVLLTTATKVAFIGWGLGSAALDFTGISGHTMFATAVYPPLAAALAASPSGRARRWATAAGLLLAVLVGLSRYRLGAHSASEVVAGWLTGGVVTAAVLGRGPVPHARPGKAWLAGTALWLALLPGAAPAMDTHALVTRLALRMSGHATPFTRSGLLRAGAPQPPETKPAPPARA
ncbi:MULTISPECIES: phosphatase PAP2 family protein [Ramlibacter]|uniref:Phosphatase PAP2 family protein n=1 Tax=Ramlibacter aquaticus TaxID=2780094 RepID=A0ABR9SFW4_9BURK|nr:MULTISPECIES: phosphatase PAP2 family protein [Ramlibacter]MBE7941221.1 phosphatase PAP2 family protein [Ramlibacter aquaticus]